ncbi:hypothetical protein M422DRAFT_780554 [Sphaerobolus stellatus SS14]|uniref:Halogenase n=1 Tax=Sphaerobolus stellatus (strain SS14) TaxID=990650 RepID=A0A0C9UCN7_SPHS4|nr:hypothetical protein M422DRAFT_780554 [Sphaerobolus stellatus SS14]
MASNSDNAMLPAKVTVLVAGGGPSGSYAASILAREGINVMVLESQKFPRYHIGESTLASIRHFLRFIDLEKTFDEYNFAKKFGAAFKLNQTRDDNYTDFVASDPSNYAWNLVRSESDHLMLQHVVSCGGLVFEETRVTDVDFEPVLGSSETRPVSAKWRNKAGQTGTVSFDYLIDASGRQGLLSTKYLKNRVINADFRNVAVWGYWSGCAEYKPGTLRAGAPYFEALTDSSGWAWLIPLNLKYTNESGTASIGIVMNQEIADAKRKDNVNSKPLSAQEHYLQTLELAPTLKSMIEDAELLRPAGEPVIRSASDYSYSAQSYAGLNYRIVGDAGAFIDPYFSSGVHLALLNGLSAAATICASMKGECQESDAAQWHTTRVDTSYTRFLIIVKSIYREIRSQQTPASSENGFDKEFEEIAPVIQGHIDCRTELSASDMEKLVDFYSRHAYEPSTTEERTNILARVQDGSFNNSTLTKRENAILNSLKVRKLYRLEDINRINHFVEDNIHGRRLKLERGRLGLVEA